MSNSSSRYSRPGPNAKLRFPLTTEEIDLLGDLDNFYGAWSRQEAAAALGESRLAVLISERVLGMQNTKMGRMYQLLARGRMSVFGTAKQARSFVAQLDRAYLRLSLMQLGWSYEVKDGVNPHYKGLAELFPHLSLKEVNTNGQYPRAVLGGKLSGGGHAAHSLHDIATRTKGDALFRRIEIIILTPSPRKGQTKAETHKSVLTLRHILPKVDDTTRFTRIPRRLSPYGNVPELLPKQATLVAARANPIPKQSISVLLLPHSERVKQAQLDIEIDGVISAFQLRRYYGLEPLDLEGRLITAALIRPLRSRAAFEVQQSLVVSGAEMARLSDNELNHRLTITEMRLSVGIAAQRAIWQVDAKPSLKLNQPDCVWISGDERAAVEADTGQYHMRVVEKKLESFAQQGYTLTVWGTGSKRRATGIKEKLGDKYRIEFLQPSWWEA